MLYASSKDALRRALVGIAVEIQGTDQSEIAYTESEFSFLPSGERGEEKKRRRGADDLVGWT